MQTNPIFERRRLSHSGTMSKYSNEVPRLVGISPRVVDINKAQK
jgi:hypothetical protein